jgi:hypothetical protein
MASQNVIIGGNGDSGDSIVLTDVLEMSFSDCSKQNIKADVKIPIENGYLLKGKIVIVGIKFNQIRYSEAKYLEISGKCTLYAKPKES